MGQIRELQVEIHSDAKDHGWWDDEEIDTSTPTKVALIVSEASEALEEYRNGHNEWEIYYNGDKPEGVPVELADIVIRTLDLAEHHMIDLETIIREKVNYNKTRSYRHGGKRF